MRGAVNVRVRQLVGEIVIHARLVHNIVVLYLIAIGLIGLAIRLAVYINSFRPAFISPVKAAILHPAP